MVTNVAFRAMEVVLGITGSQTNAFFGDWDILQNFRVSLGRTVSVCGIMKILQIFKLFLKDLREETASNRFMESHQSRLCTFTIRNYSISIKNSSLSKR